MDDGGCMMCFDPHGNRLLAVESKQTKREAHMSNTFNNIQHETYPIALLLPPWSAMGDHGLEWLWSLWLGVYGPTIEWSQRWPASLFFLPSTPCYARLELAILSGIWKYPEMTMGTITPGTSSSMRTAWLLSNYSGFRLFAICLIARFGYLQVTPNHFLSAWC